MSPLRVSCLTLLAMIAFAGNSLLCRMALRHTTIDPASFTSVRLASGAAVLYLLARTRTSSARGQGSWKSAVALLIYAAGFSFAYVNLPAATGALLLFGAVQISMISHGLWRGERLRAMQWLGLLLAAAGVIGLLLPGLTAPPLQASLLMIGAGVAWGVYSLRGRGAGDPTRVTAGNFARAVPIALLCSLLQWRSASVDPAGLAYALASGALASGIGYAIWYAVLPGLKATTAATVQLSVPALAAMGGILFLGEPFGFRLLVASVAILGGIVLVIVQRQR
ncbi:DMT family transporter [Silvimonas sp.]|uniref:DMT family transporter n=1 Tax=Silvimonas sp. TaxID=2650811 RepID=UPI0028442A30|nr:DMT family transporter [Silvimonas sp.]MDR3428870.1 DMT family transporter [Silvimonas sp.]